MPRPQSLYIPLHANLRSHPKTLRLARRLKTSVPETVGHLAFLWTFAMGSAPDGDLSRFSDEDLALAADYHGPEDAFVRALEECGFLVDRVLHDWSDYGGALLQKRRSEADRKAAWRARNILPLPEPEDDDATDKPYPNGVSATDKPYNEPKSDATLTVSKNGVSRLSPADVPGTNANVPRTNGDVRRKRREEEIKVKEITPIPPTDAESGLAAGEEGPSFDRFWSDYPRKEDKRNTAKVWDRLSPEDRVAACIGLQRVRPVYLRRKEAGETGYIPHPSTWLNGRRWEDDDAPPPPASNGAHAPLPSRPSTETARDAYLRRRGETR